MSSAVKTPSSVPSQTEPPRGTMASPNTVMTIAPVRDGVPRLRCVVFGGAGGGRGAGGRGGGAMRKGKAFFVVLQKRRPPLLLPFLQGGKWGMRGCFRKFDRA